MKMISELKAKVAAPTAELAEHKSVRGQLNTAGLEMRKLGYKLIDSVLRSIADGWEFTVDKFIEPLPKYLSKIRYEIEGEP